MRQIESPTSLETAINTIGNKWRLHILFQLQYSMMRFSHLKSAIPSITHKMLIQELRNLITAGLVERKIYAQIPPKVEYFLTIKGQSVIPLIQMMCQWGSYYNNVTTTNSNYTPLPNMMARPLAPSPQ